MCKIAAEAEEAAAVLASEGVELLPEDELSRLQAIDSLTGVSSI